MRRDLGALCNNEFDLVIVGGGIFGVCAAWDATLRGMSVAIVERGDFAQATSANSFKMVHGGIRYLQHGDIYRIRQSCIERRAFLRIAPHLVAPLPIVLPTYGKGMSGKAALRTGLLAYDLLTPDRNRGINDPRRQIPWGRCLSRREVLDLFPMLEDEDPELTGAAVFCDGQMYNPPRLAISILRSACQNGVHAANYVKVTGWCRTEDRITGVRALDLLGGQELEIRGRYVLNATGPYAEWLLQQTLGLDLNPVGTYSRDACFVVGRPWHNEYALAVRGATQDPDAVVSRGARHLFLVPWRDYTLVGVWHVVHRGPPDEFTVREEELVDFLTEINGACPSLGLTLDDITTWNAGLVPFGENAPGAVHLRYGKRSRLIDHQQAHGIEGLITLIGVRYTTARGEAAGAIDLICQKLGRPRKHPDTDRRPVFGGDFESFDNLTRAAKDEHPSRVNGKALHALLRNYGSAYGNVLRYTEDDPSLSDTVGDSTVLKAEIVHAIHEEMAQTLGDAVFRRTDLATGALPDTTQLEACAELMGSELSWTNAKREQQLTDVQRCFPNVPGHKTECIAP